jgi:TRAP transporter TAXI family solute receptor
MYRLSAQWQQYNRGGIAVESRRFWIFWLVLVLLLGIGAWWGVSRIIATDSYHIRIATGSTKGMYYQYALAYQKRLKLQHVEVEIVPTAGSLEAQKLLVDQKVDIAFVQGGTVDESLNEKLEAIASIYLEPLWIFARASLDPIEKLTQMRGKRLVIGTKGSGTQSVVRKLLAANGIDANNTTLIFRGATEGKAMLEHAEADIFFTIISPQSPLVAALFTDENLRAISLKRIKAYETQFAFLTHYDIAEGYFNLTTNKPPNDVQLLSTVATLATHHDFPPELIRLFLREINVVHAQQTLFGEKEPFPSSHYLELPVNEDAQRYLQNGESWLEKIFPYWVAYNINRFKLLLIPILTLLLPLFKGIMPLYQWRVRRRIYRWYRDLIEIESLYHTGESVDYEEMVMRLDQLLREIAGETKVPLSYAGELYDLKTHIEFVLDRVEYKREKEPAKNARRRDTM